ncbi:hypothetical protein RZO55_05590 [Clostridium boliviensis]|uniref:Uncharacterized protein n=1 Tax=Clostridium boliviensis TaxID=318465 RepID=A0ABU4GLC4_9CLOT|nr:hypothetical protein [Clostridium boliviensis]MDW2797052.1 hypothetical protein [Clostridium boliviensis]
MAKCGVTNIGGGGISSDEVSAAKENVLSGKTYVGTDTGDEIGTGTMENNGSTGNQNLNAGSSFLVKKGYHAQDFSVGANNLASQTSGTASAGQILSGQTAWINGNKVTGNIPLQSGDASSDQVWSTNRTTWGDGNLFFGVRNGHYLNGINWIRSYDAAFVPANIKKGVNIFGVTGTWEGYVPGVNDLYYRGNNMVGFTGGVKFDSGQMTIDYYTVDLIANFSLVGKTYLNIQGMEGNSPDNVTIYTKRNSYEVIANWSQPGGGTHNLKPYLYSINISGAQVSGLIKISLHCFNGLIYRIWLS